MWPDPWTEGDWDITIEQLVARKFILVIMLVIV